MKKILLLIEDYTERAFLNGLLKRLGWDVESAQTELGINDLLLGFSPHIVIATGFGAKIKGEALRERLNKLSLRSEIILVVKKRILTDAQLISLGIYKALPSPIDVQALFKALEALGGISASKAFQKLAVRSASENTAEEMDRWVQSAKKRPDEAKLENREVKGASQELVPENPLNSLNKGREKVNSYKFNDATRAARYSQFVKENPLPESKFNGLDPKFVEEQVKEFRRLEDDPEIKEIDDERKAFAVAMFRIAKEEKKS